MSLQNLTRFPRLELIGAPTPLEYLPASVRSPWARNFY
ncbi:D-cysteine desulfhydrase [Klebsiella pneumoniae subsp. rhinoscleromatis]|uniref:D-cysteine desulfhydrase n=1 Tax=Klebsiella pneumoniae TaxID=573 RepID=A0A447S655_KLEPN|nr:D-cysteine desulfhydrase [Klebsiella pneumoniae subsp. rhinoscleromatis]VEB07591.1 D-cysteine desulfhydrase [Klebsiella pneumoniae]